MRRTVCAPPQASRIRARARPRGVTVFQLACTVQPALALTLSSIAARICLSSRLKGPVKISQRIVWCWVLVELAGCECTVNPSVEQLAIRLEPASLTLAAGGERGTLIARRLGSGEDVTAQVTWLSENPGVASVEGGRVSGRARGSSTITAQLDGFSATADVDVTVACVDGLKNGEETDVDCGGPFCAACALGHTCTSDSDCRSTQCVSGLCAPLGTCFDGVRNGSESSVDCGGHGCAACGTGQACGGNLDCRSTICVRGVCQAPSCTDGAKNGSETAIDCGGSGCPGCLAGTQCTSGNDCASGVCLRGACREAACSDGVKNGLETALDCGGPTCPTCSAGVACLTGTDCQSGVCTGGLCQPPACNDGLKNGDETSDDCGGRDCAPCAPWNACNVSGDCASGVCRDGVCKPATCTDGVRNGAETGLDCGGFSCPACAPGQGCTSSGDCSSAVCAGGLCQSPSCSDGQRNGTETAVDCGGSCAACVTGQGCMQGADCASNVCSSGLCVAATCIDGVQNAAETSIDCGGGSCPACGTGQRCAQSSDCRSSVCTNGICVAASCGDGVLNGAETFTDCGGGSCAACAPGQGCARSSDCGSGVCSGGACAAPTCGDGVHNGAETAVDCGGGSCPTCESGQGCTQAADCASSVCTSGLCAAANCSDAVSNGTETGVDCGGGLCAACAQGQQCRANSDCASNNCAQRTCDVPIIVALEIAPATAVVPLGRTQAFSAIARSSDGTAANVTASVTWQSSNPGAGSISVTGLLRALTSGTTEVQALYRGHTSNRVDVTISAPALDRIDVTPAGVRLPIGLVQAYEATGTFSDGSIHDLTSSVAWSSSTPSVASVAGGLATARAAGTTNIVATAGGVSGQVPLVVTTVSVTSISVSPASSTLPAGVRAAYSAVALLSDGTARDITAQATWASSSPGVATVSSSSPTRGLVTAQAAGTTNITASLAGNTGSGVLTVINATLSSIQVFPADETVPQGFSLQYGAVGLYSNGSAYDLTLTATWSSTTPAVASVSNTFPEQGVVATLAPGTTQIRAALGALSGSTSLRVSNAQLTALSITPALLTLPIGAAHRYGATGVFDDGTARDVTALVRWASSNLAVASISNAVSTRGLVFTMGAGSATITATLGTRTAASALQVTNATLEQLVVTPPAPRIGRQGVVSFVATAIYTDGTSLDVTELSAWTSSRPAIATVRNDTGFRGLAVGLAEGDSTITAAFASTSAAAALTVTDATLETLYISPAEVRTGVGIRLQYSAAGVWSDGTTADLTRAATWTSSLASVAVISNAAGSQGLATTRGQGVTTIRASWAGADDSTTLTVTNATLRSLTVTPPSTTTGIGVQVRYRAVAAFSDGSTLDVTTGAAWSSSQPQVASISGGFGSAGVAMALSGGTTTIAARMGTISGTASLTVSSAALVSVTVTPATGVIPIGYWRKYSATANFGGGLSVDVTTQATWTTGSPTVASAGNGLLHGGRVTGLRAGTSSVTARFGARSGTATATVRSLRLVDLDVTPLNPRTPVGVPIQLTAMGEFADPNANCDWNGWWDDLLRGRDEDHCSHGTALVTLELTQQIGWMVWPKRNGTVSNTDGSRGMVTMYSPSAFALVLAMRWEPVGRWITIGHGFVYSP